MSADENNEVEAAEEVMVEQCPNPQDRLLLLERLLASADVAKGVAPNACTTDSLPAGVILNTTPPYGAPLPDVIP